MARWTLEQQKAIDVRGHNIIVSAGAGSGKTAVLTERVFQILKQGASLDEILVLTFTNAAASEMRARIRSKLRNEPSLENLASKIDASDICTFDAYALSLVKKYHYVLGVSANVSIIDENIVKIKKRKLLNSIFDSLYEQKNEPFLTFINKYALRSDDDLQDFVLRIDEMINLKIDKKGYLKNYLSEYYSISRIQHDLEEFRQHIRSIAITTQRGALEYENPKMSDSVCKALEPIITAPDYDTFNEALSLFKFPSRNKLSEEDSLLHESLSSACDKFTSYAAIGKSSDVISRYQATQETVALLLEMIEKLNEKLDRFKKTYEVYTFSDIAKMALMLVKNTEVGKTLQKKLKFIMIDEYQDTSDIQEEFVSNIGNENVYMVGDIKQSIYRFRNANSEIFANKYSQYKKGLGGEAIDLNKNFRSRSEVIQDINTLFSDIMSADFGGADYRREHLIEVGNIAYDQLGANSENHHLEVLRYEKKDPGEKMEIEAALIAEDILSKIQKGYSVFDKDKNLPGQAEFKDFAILIDRKTKFEIFQKVFSEYGIPLKVEKDADLSDSDVILAFQNLVRLFFLTSQNLFDETFRHSFMSIARSFLFRLPDQMILDILKSKQYEQNEIIVKMRKITEARKSYPLSEILSSLVDEFAFFEKTVEVGNVAENRHKIQGLIELSLSLEKIGYGIKEFVDYFDDLSTYEITLAVPNQEVVENCVRLMSIHKSKGLEFPIIYYAGLGSRFNDQNMKSSFLADSRYGIVLPIIDEMEASNLYHYLIKINERKAELSEQIRLFYVALTRAKEKMICLYQIPQKEKVPLLSVDGANSFSDFIRFVEAEQKYGKNVELTGIKTKFSKENIKDLHVILKENSIPAMVITSKRASKTSSEKVDQKLLDFGTRIHALLEIVDFKKSDLSFITDVREKALIEKALKASIFQSLDGAEIFKEYQFIDTDNHVNGIIDLLLVFKEHCLIVDYKLKNLDDEAYRQQLTVYQRFVEQSFKRNTECFLLSVLTGEVKKVNTL